MYIALKRMKVGERHREYGEDIPEAEQWPWQVRENYIRSGYIRVKADVAPAVAAAKGARHGNN